MLTQWCRPRIIALLFLCLFATASLYAQTISGTVVDPKGAVIVGARVEITGGDLSAPLLLSTDRLGKFVSPELKPGMYVVRVAQSGFETLEQKIDLTKATEFQLAMAIEVKPTNITVTTPTGFANADPLYRQLRGVGLGESYAVEDLSLTPDVETFQMKKGTLTFLAPVDGMVTGAIFVGEGHFTLKPATDLDAHELERRTGAAQCDEDFTEVVFRFTGDVRASFSKGLGQNKVGTPEAAGSAFAHWAERMRKRREIPLGFTEYLLDGESIDNVDADVLAAVYNHAHPIFFNAYIRGKKHKDLRFFLRTRVGALPQLDSPEEVALINFDPEGFNDGVWYLAHLRSEYAKHTASSDEERRLFATHRYKIETVIAKNRHLFSTAKIYFEPLLAGERVLKFGLLPNLRVSRVLDDQEQNLQFIQESRKEDGSFYVVLSKAPALKQETSITVEYAGDKVIESAGEGSYYIQARTSWYPNLNGFGERALYDLTYKVPKKYKVISVGTLKNESVEGDLAITHWVTATPVAIAGFNYGDYQKVDITEDKLGYKIYGYYLAELPDNLRGYRALATMAPHSMTEYALQQTRAQLQLCTYYFGKSPFDTIYITEQPNFNFGQSWPNLVYLPISAYTDSTQRWMLFGNINTKFTGFVQEVTPHEVAHQWWGHSVGWSSYHDQWLSEGFAEFSAGLFLQQAVGGDWRHDYLEFWDRLRRRILDKNRYGVAPNDAGPLWMGLRLISPKTSDAYQNVTYPKGAYVLQMLRSMMYSEGEKEFIAMMHDFVESHRDRPASTESFKAIAEKHITRSMDLQGNGKLDWFFNEWVYGTQVPRYKFEYQATPAENGKTKLAMTLTQSEVNENFAMIVPIFADFGKGLSRIGQIPIAGNATRTVTVFLPATPKKVVLNAYRDVLER